MKENAAIARWATPATIAEALDHLTDSGSVALAGASWIMRAPLRHESKPPKFVALSKLDLLRTFDIQASVITIGALATHDQLQNRLAAYPDVAALVQAAGRSANPGVRRIATVGGNLCTPAFAAADLVPALLCLEAEIEIQTLAGVEVLPIAEFLSRRTALPQPWILTRIFLKRSKRFSRHERLPMRRAGDYATGIASLSAAADGKGRLSDIRIGIGSIEMVARRWHRLEAALNDKGISPTVAEEAAREFIGDFTGRDDGDCPGWYRTEILPALIRRAVQALEADFKQRAA